MIAPKEDVSAFAHRLGEILSGDDADPEVFVTPAVCSRIEVDGRAQFDMDGGEAILIVRGPEAGRKQALCHLLAELTTR